MVDGLGAAAGVELFENAAAELVYETVAEMEAVLYFLVNHAALEKLDDPLLTLAERAEAARRPRTPFVQ